MRRVIEDYRRIDAYLALRLGWIERNDTLLVITDNGLRYEVTVKWRRLSVGNFRPNFICPECKQPKVKLALIEPGKFQCQKCSGLPNRSRQQTRFTRAADRLRKLQRLTGREDWEDVSQPVLRRPKGMHHATFERLVQRAEAACDIMAESPWYPFWVSRPLKICR